VPVKFIGTQVCVPTAQPSPQPSRTSRKIPRPNSEGKPSKQSKVSKKEKAAKALPSMPAPSDNAPLLQHMALPAPFPLGLAPPPRPPAPVPSALPAPQAIGRRASRADPVIAQTASGIGGHPLPKTAPLPLRTDSAGSRPLSAIPRLPGTSSRPSTSPSPRAGAGDTSHRFMDTALREFPTLLATPAVTAPLSQLEDGCPEDQSKISPSPPVPPLATGQDVIIADLLHSPGRATVDLPKASGLVQAFEEGFPILPPPCAVGQTFGNSDSGDDEAANSGAVTEGAEGVQGKKCCAVLCSSLRAVFR